jgi:hypothetical protein
MPANPPRGVYLSDDMWAWLLKQDAGASGTLRMLIGDAMGDKMRGKRKKDLEEQLHTLQAEIELEGQKKLQAEAETREALEAKIRAETDQKAIWQIEDARWDKYRAEHPHWNEGLDFPEQRALVAAVKRGDAPPSPPTQTVGGGGTSDEQRQGPDQTASQ